MLFTLTTTDHSLWLLLVTTMTFETIMKGQNFAVWLLHLPFDPDVFQGFVDLVLPQKLQDDAKCLMPWAISGRNATGDDGWFNVFVLHHGQRGRYCAMKVQSPSRI